MHYFFYVFQIYPSTEHGGPGSSSGSYGSNPSTPVSSSSPISGAFRTLRCAEAMVTIVFVAQYMYSAKLS